MCPQSTNAPFLSSSIIQLERQEQCQMMQGVYAAAASTTAPLTERKNCIAVSISINLSPLCLQHLNLMSPWSLSTQEAGLTNGTPVETSSPASASSLFNRLQLDDDLEADVRDLYASTETRDLFVTVDDPKKHVSTMETYITYRVSTKVCYWLVS